MLNIVVPMAGNSLFFEQQEWKFPKPLIEIKKKMMIAHPHFLSNPPDSAK